MFFHKVLPKKGEFGFTVVEVVMVVLIAGAMLAVAMPSLTNWVGKNRLNAVASRIVNDLHFCRQQAISENNYYVIDFNSSVPIQYTIKNGQTIGTYTDVRTVNHSDSKGFITFVASGDPVFNYNNKTAKP